MTGGPGGTASGAGGTGDLGYGLGGLALLGTTGVIGATKCYRHPLASLGSPSVTMVLWHHWGPQVSLGSLSNIRVYQGSWASLGSHLASLGSPGVPWVIWHHMVSLGVPGITRQCQSPLASPGSPNVTRVPRCHWDALPPPPGSPGTAECPQASPSHPRGPLASLWSPDASMVPGHQWGPPVSPGSPVTTGVPQRHRDPPRHLPGPRASLVSPVLP